MFTNDIEDAFQVILVIADCEDSDTEYYQKIRKNWEQTVSKMIIEKIDLSTSLKIRKTNHGRFVDLKHLNNPIIIGRTNGNNLIALDGNHRLLQHIENQNEIITAYILDISWLDGADDMEFD